ncbi:MAG: hypothetical protein KFH98_05025, partial [Gemmatimonadetes bacterium]|nr:hypothetical protein [Gemmatimonadota bacterium]
AFVALTAVALTEVALTEVVLTEVVVTAVALTNTAAATAVIAAMGRGSARRHGRVSEQFDAVSIRLP